MVVRVDEMGSDGRRTGTRWVLLLLRYLDECEDVEH